MSNESIDRRLHRHHDDDLSAEERTALDAEIAASPELGKKLEGLREVGAVLRAARTDDAPIDGDALYRAIEAAIIAPEANEAPATAKPLLRAIEGGAKAAPVIAPSAPLAAEDPRARRRRQIGIAVGAFAIAAAALLMVYGPPGTEPETIAEGTPDTMVPDEVPQEPTASESANDYTEVLAVDFGANVGTIFAVEGEGGQRYAVVWLDDVMKTNEGPLPTEDVATTPD